MIKNIIVNLINRFYIWQTVRAMQRVKKILRWQGFDRSTRRRLLKQFYTDTNENIISNIAAGRSNKQQKQQPRPADQPGQEKQIAPGGFKSTEK